MVPAGWVIHAIGTEEFALTASRVSVAGSRDASQPEITIRDSSDSEPSAGASREAS